jgi:hypothetical protein
MATLKTTGAAVALVDQKARVPAFAAFKLSSNPPVPALAGR